MSKPRSANICHDSARECVRLARMSDDPELRYELFEMARQWMAIAMEEEDRLREQASDERARQLRSEDRERKRALVLA